MNQVEIKFILGDSALFSSGSWLNHLALKHMIKYKGNLGNPYDVFFFPLMLFK